MKLYLIEQNENVNYDTYDSAVVAAPDEHTARHTHPNGYDMNADEWTRRYSSWCSSPDKVKVTFIGEAMPDVVRGVICASFNAG